MADIVSKEKRSQIMAAIRSKGNRETEIKLVSIFRAYKITGWQRNRKLVGKPDFVFPKQRVAVFVDGCFWHGCRWHCRMPEDNRDYWQKKISRNRKRDRKVNEALIRKGWRVVRIWEHALRLQDRVVEKLKTELRAGHQRRRIAHSKYEEQLSQQSFC